MLKMYHKQSEIINWKYIVASEDTQTSTDSVFVAGDIPIKPKKVVTAACEGDVAGIIAKKICHQYKTAN